MSFLRSIAAPDDPAEIAAAHRIDALPVLVIFPHNQCNCRCVMCDIWRIREAQEITPADLEQHLGSFRKLGVHWVVFSGGEPQLNEKWSSLAQMLRSAGSRVTLLTAGLLLKPQARVIAACIDDVIVSLDGPPAVHNSIRRISGAFEQMADGVKALHDLRPEMPVRGALYGSKSKSSFAAGSRCLCKTDRIDVSFISGGRPDIFSLQSSRGLAPGAARAGRSDFRRDR